MTVPIEQEAAASAGNIDLRNTSLEQEKANSVASAEQMDLNHEQETEAPMASTDIPDTPLEQTNANPSVLTDRMDMTFEQENADPVVSTDSMVGLEARTQEIDGTAQAEFEYDSDFEDSSSSSASDSSDDDSSSGDSVVLDVATKARMLMAGEGDEEEAGNKGSAETAPRTANEVEEEDIPIPEVEITEQMEITILGAIEHIVENTAIIKGETSAEYRVLEPGSILCDRNRKLAGVVLDTIGPVQQPYYSTKLKKSQDPSSEEPQIQAGQQLYYVNDHSHFVFTEPLRQKKHYDASNIHDEEIPEDAQEFSDDEKEREFKAQRKEAKKAGRGGLSRSDFTGRQQQSTSSYDRSDAPRHVKDGDVAGERHVGGLSYDDDGADDDGFYQPLKRPANLTQTMRSDSFRGGTDRGSHNSGGRYDGRSRNDRNDRPGRGGGHADRGRRGSAGRGRSDNRQPSGGRAGFDSGQMNGSHEHQAAHSATTVNPSTGPMSTYGTQSGTTMAHNASQSFGSGVHQYAGASQSYMYQNAYPTQANQPASSSYHNSMPTSQGAFPLANPAYPYPAPNPYIQTGGVTAQPTAYGVPISYTAAPLQYSNSHASQQQYQYNGYQYGNVAEQNGRPGGLHGLPGSQGPINAQAMYAAAVPGHQVAPSGPQAVPSPAQQQQHIADFLAFVKTQQPPG